MTDLKKKQTIVRFNDATPSAGVYSFVLTAPIEDAVYLDWGGASENLTTKFVNVAEFENNGQTTANITVIEVDEPAIATAPEPEVPEPDAIAPYFDEDSKAYVKGSVVREDNEVGNYWIFNFPEFSTPGAGEEGELPGASWANITASIAEPYTPYLYSAVKLYKTGEYAYYDGDWFRWSGGLSLAPLPGVGDWVGVDYLGDGNTFDEATYYTLGSDIYADPIVRINVGEESPEYQFWKHSYFTGIANTKIRNPTASGQSGWSAFTPYVKILPVYVKPFVPYIPPALPRSSQVAGKYWRFITSPINSETLIINDRLSKPKTYKTLTIRVYNLDGSIYEADETDYLIINSWNK